MRVVRHPHMYPIEQDVDEDHSGFITFDELQSVVRRKLRKGPSVLDDGALKALWCAIDTNDSDRLERDEFARFLRLGTAASIEGAIKPPHKAPPRVVRSSTGSANSSCSSNQDIPDARVAATPRDETPNVTAGHFAEMHLDKDSDMAVDPSRQQWEVSADAMLSRDSLHESLLQLAPVSPSPPSLGEAMHMHQDQRAYLATTPGSTAHAAPARGTMMRTSATEPMLVRTPPGAYAYTGSGGRGGGRGIGAGSGRSGGGARASGAAGHVVRRQPQSLVRPPAQQSKARSPGAAPSGFAAWGSPAPGLGSHTVGSPAGGGSRGNGSGAARVRPTSAPAPYASAGALPARAVSELAAIKELAGGANQLLASERQEAAKMRMEAYLAVQAAQAETSAAIARAAEREKAAAAAEAKLAMMREQIDATGRRDDLRLSTRLAGQRRMLEKEVRKVHVDAQLESEVQLAAMQLESSEAKVAQARLAATEIERSQLQRTIDELKEELATREREHQMAIEQAEAAALAKAGAVHDEEMRAASIARLQQQAARRLSQQGLARGFGTWRDGYLDRRWKMERLRVAVATMMRPQLMRGFGVWRDTCVRSAQHRAMQVVTSQAKDEASRHAEELEAARTELSKARKTLEREVARLRSEHAAELEAERASAATEMKRAQSDSASELAKARAALAELKEVFETTDEHVQRISLEREAAMQRLQQQVVRRLRLQGISRGFNAWRDGYRDQKWKMERLRIAAATMLRPQLMRGFGVWKEGWLQAKHRAAEQVHHSKGEYEAACHADELTAARAALAEAQRSHQAEVARLQREHAAAMDAEREAANQELERVAHEHALTLAAQRAASEEMVRTLQSDASTREEELTRKLSGEIEASHEAAVATIARQALRKLTQQALSRGFNAWADGYRQRVRQQRLLRHAAARMAKPLLAEAMHEWIGAWEVAVRARERAEAQASLSAEAERARSLEAELAASHAAKEKAAARAAEVEATAKGAAATEATLTQSLERARSEGERLSAELALERTALGDERQKAVALVAELEKLRQQVALGREAEVAAREAVAAATHRCKLAEERAASAEQSEAEFRTGTEARLSALLADQRHSLEEVTAIVRAESAVGIERLTKEKRALEQRVRKLEEELSKRPPAPKPAQAEQTDGESVDSDEERRRRQLHKIKVKPFNFLSDARAGGRTTRLERLRMQEVAAAFRAKLAAKSRRGRGGAHEPMTDERAATKLQAVWRGRQIRVLLKHSRPSSPSSAGSPRPVRPRPKALP